MNLLGTVDVSSEDRAFLDEITAFVDDEVCPVVRERDARDEYPADLVSRMKELGVLGASSRPLPVFALMVEELARGWVSLTPIVNTHSTTLWVLRTFGTASQQERWLARMERGEVLSAYALTEPGGGSDLASATSTATRVEGGWRIDAHKTYITHARNSNAMLVLVKTVAEEKHGFSLFILEHGEWEVLRDLDKTGSRAVETTELRIDGVVVGDDRLVGGEPGRGFVQVMESLEIGRIAVAAEAVGLGRAALWTAVEHARSRMAFGQPVLEFQGLRFELADIATKVAAARSLVLGCAMRKQRGGRTDLETSMAKLYASEMAAEAALQAVRTLGGAGYIKDFDADRLYRDAPLYVVGEGANGVLKMLIGRWLATADRSLDWL